MDARPGGPTAKRQPSPEGLGINPQENASAVGAALKRSVSRYSTYCPAQSLPGVVIPAVADTPDEHLISCCERMTIGFVSRLSAASRTRPALVAGSESPDHVFPER
jgi:hypothetical protein